MPHAVANAFTYLWSVLDHAHRRDLVWFCSVGSTLNGAGANPSYLLLYTWYEFSAQMRRASPVSTGYLVLVFVYLMILLLVGRLFYTFSCYNKMALIGYSIEKPPVLSFK